MKIGSMFFLTTCFQTSSSPSITLLKTKSADEQLCTIRANNCNYYKSIHKPQKLVISPKIGLIDMRVLEPGEHNNESSKLRQNLAPETPYTTVPIHLLFLTSNVICCNNHHRWGQNGANCWPRLTSFLTDANLFSNILKFILKIF